MSKPLLSICIPTYNRWKYLMNTLNSIIYQEEFQTGQVEIIISDNASTDNTEKIAKEYASHFKNIWYYRNAENICDHNFPLALKRGNGIYRKLHNDTLLCIPGSLRYMCTMVERYRETEKILFLLNGNGRNFKDDTIECTSFEQFVNTAGIWTGWIGAFGLWESTIERITENDSECEMKLWQCKKVYEMIEEKGEGIVINRRLFINQEVPQKDMSYGVYQVLHLNYLSILQDYVDRKMISRESYETLRINNLYRLAFFISRSEIKRQQWYMPDVEATKSLVYREVKESGIWEDYLRYCKRKKWLYPMRMNCRNVLLKIYCLYLALLVFAIERL